MLMVTEVCSVSCQANTGFQIQILPTENYFIYLFILPSIITLHITAVSGSLEFHHELTAPAAEKP